MLRKSKFSILTIILVLAFAQVASAQLASMGPINPVAAPGNGFPQWYKDANGVTVDLPIPPLGSPPPAVVTPTMIFSAVDPAFPYSAQTGFGAEAFYFNAVSDKNFQTKDSKVTVLMGLEAGYANLQPTAGQQSVFSRIRITVPKVLVAGTYTFRHPWGVETINVPAADVTAGRGNIKFTKDVGLGAGWLPDLVTPVATPGGFYQVLQAGNTMSTFLRATTMAAGVDPLQWIGDGVTSSTFTGSPIAYNKIRLEAPAGTNLDGKGNNFIESPNLIISGHIPANTAVPMPLSMDRVTCSHITTPGGPVEHVDVFLSSQPLAVVTVSDITAGLPGVLMGSGTVNTNGKFFASYASTAQVVSVTVTPAAGVLGFTPTTKTANVVDYVNITSCNFSLSTNVLTIQATSSDWFKHPTTPPVLTAAGFGTLTFNTLGTATLAVPMTTPVPPTVSVNSQLNRGTAALPVLVPGGSDTAQTGIVP